ncbi:MAG: hypothetical protein FJX61_04555 [Alphaproteobacteria bacterium]|nr:hypothetical protein [Alphaproteobacteria bacterium]
MGRGARGLAAFAAVAWAVVGHGAAADGVTTVAALARATHFHGLAVDAADPTRVYLATHHGLYAVGADGTARAVSKDRHDFMGFAAHPTEPDVLFSSGHPAHGGNLGFMVSTDRGVTWRKRADGVGGPVDFHQMDVSKADPRVVYGVHDGLQVSRDGGKTWATAAPAPPTCCRSRPRLRPPIRFMPRPCRACCGAPTAVARGRARIRNAPPRPW